MTRWKRESVKRYGAPDACRIHYAPETTRRGQGFNTLALVARCRRNRTVPLEVLGTLLAIARAYLAPGAA